MLAGEGGIEDRGVVIGVPGADIHTGTDPLGTEAPPGLRVGSGVFTEVVEARFGDGASGSFLSETGSFAYKRYIIKSAFFPNLSLCLSVCLSLSLIIPNSTCT